MSKNKNNMLIFGIMGVVIIAIIIGVVLFIPKSNTDINNNNQNNDGDIITSDTTPESDKTTENNNLIKNIITTDTSKIKSALIDWNNSIDSNSEGIFSDVTISEKDKIFSINYTVTDDYKSVLMLNLIGIIVGLKTYEINSDFEKINIIYLDNKNKKLGETNIPNKAIKDIYDYNQINPDTDLTDNPYIDAYNKLSTSLYDPSLPQLFPESMAQDQFGSSADDASEIDIALTKKVTHLEIDCWGSKNWDSDAEDDGIIYYIKPISDDGTIVPIEGTFVTDAYSIEMTDYWDYIKKDKVYSKTDSLEGSDRFDYFDLYDGYQIGLDWSEVTPFMASYEDNGYLYVTFTDKQNNSYSAKIEDTYSNCILRDN
ncbi:MAG: hypothetical protein PHN22_04445 [Candidatus ainarchaeum sp.]|nr:hypothetical protein [Candidatus ainarchaeum sp.]